MNVLFINDSTSNPNWGDRAAAIALRSMIVDSGGRVAHAISEDELNGSLFSGNIAGRTDRSIARQVRLAKAVGLFAPPILAKASAKVRRYFGAPSNDELDDAVPRGWEDCEKKAQLVLASKDYGDLRATFEQSDLAVIHGDGCMVGNARIARAQLFLAYLLKRHFKKPVIIVNHTADFDHSNLRRMAQAIYPLFDDVVFRDFISAERCQSFCKGRVAADSAFLFKPVLPENWLPVARRHTYFDVWPDTARFDPASAYICIGGSSLYYYNRQTDPVREFSFLIEHLKAIYSGQIVLTASDLRDQIIFRPVAKLFDLPLVGLTTPVQQAIDIVGNAEAYIGGRWHPSIFALRGGTPIVPLSSSTFKMQALADASGLHSPMFDSLNLGQEAVKIGRQLKLYLEEGNEMRGRIRSWAETECEKSWGNVSYLRAVIGQVQSSH